jgi:hypothetical protein
MCEFYLRSKKIKVLLEKNFEDVIIGRPYQIKILFREF